MKIFTKMALGASGFLWVAWSMGAAAASGCNDYFSIQNIASCKDIRSMKVEHVIEADANQLYYQLYDMSYFLNLDASKVYVTSLYHPRKETVEITLMSDDSKAMDEKKPFVEDYLKNNLGITGSFVVADPHVYVFQEGDVWDDYQSTIHKKVFFLKEVGVLTRAETAAYLEVWTKYRKALDSEDDWKTMLKKVSEDAVTDWAEYDGCTEHSCRFTFDHYLEWTSFPELFNSEEPVEPPYTLHSERYL